jgi:hypothetical protein
MVSDDLLDLMVFVVISPSAKGETKQKQTNLVFSPHFSQVGQESVNLIYFF